MKPEAIVKSEFIYERASFPSCHASTLVELPDGTLLAAWFGGTAESAPDVKVYLSRQSKKEWSSPVAVADGIQDSGKALPCYNPVLFQPRRGPLLLFYKVGTGPATWWGMLTSSADSGKTWSKPHRLPDGILGPIKNKPVELPGGELLCPSSSENNGWQVHFERTFDFGKTWQSTAPVNDGKSIGAIQPSILPLGGRRLRAIGRTQQGKMFVIDSPDAGRSWEPMRLLDTPNPNSGTDAIPLRDGRFLLAYNNTPQGRTPLTIAVSFDGLAWQPALALEDAPGEYSYPTVLQTRDGLVHVTYTWQRKRIRHAVLDPERLRPVETTPLAWRRGTR